LKAQAGLLLLRFETAGKNVFGHCSEKAKHLLHDVSHAAKAHAIMLDSRSFDLEEQLLWHSQCAGTFGDGRREPNEFSIAILLSGVPTLEEFSNERSTDS
jgi:hypothetical protein